MTIDDIARFTSFYSHRIRKLTLERASGNEPPSEVFQALRNLNIGLIAPNLTCLRWYSEYLWEFEDVFSSISLFLGSNLIDIGIHIHPENSDHRNLVSTVANKYPDLESLRITFGSPSPPADFWEEVTPTFQFNNLHSLIIPHLSTTVLERLSRLPDLQDIYLSDFNFLVEVPRDLEGDKIRFPSLKELVVVTANFDMCFNLIPYLSPTSPLRRFSLTCAPLVPIAPSMREWQQLLHLIGRHCNPDTLMRLELQDSDYIDPDVLLPAPTSSLEGDIEKIDIEPLFAFKNLEALELSFAYGLSLTKPDLQRIPSNWKSMTYMYLCSHYPSYRVPTINHEDVVALVKACPKLWGLGVIFDTNQIPETPTLLLEKPLKRFQRLKVGNSPIESVGVITKFLAMHFPRLAEVMPCGTVRQFPDSAELSRKWSEVQEGLRDAILERRRARVVPN
ncbi:hypothetical protein H1R20_g11461, partial [Candolleomyces eurysporus]